MSEDARHNNTWTTDEFSDLVTAWEMSASRPRDRGAPTLHDAVYKHFVALRGGSTRRNAAALTSRRSALKFSYLFVRDFNASQKLKQDKSFFELSPAKRQEVMTNWKKTNSSVVELTPVMCQSLARIVGEEASIRRRVKETKEVQDPQMGTRPTRASSVASTSSSVSSTKTPGKRKQPTVSRVMNGPWTAEEMKQLVKAWGLAAQKVCESESNVPIYIVHEMQREFEKLQGVNKGRNLSSLGTRRRVLKHSYYRIAAFDKIQKINGDPMFTELPTAARQNVIRSWNTSNLLDLPADLYAELEKVVTLDAQAAALEDLRRGATKVLSSGTVNTSRKPGRPTKTQRVEKIVQETKEDDEESVFSSQPPSVVDDSEEEKAAIPMMIVQSVTSNDKETKSADLRKNSTSETSVPVRFEDVRQRKSSTFPVNSDRSALALAKPNIGENYHFTKANGDEEEKTAPPIPRSEIADLIVSVAVEHDRSGKKAVSTADDTLDVEKTISQRIFKQSLDLKPPASPVQEESASKMKPIELENNQPAFEKEDPNETAVTITSSKGGGRWGKRKPKVQPDGPTGPTGHFWSNAELENLVKAWEKAAILVCTSEPAERLSLNREMYREFVAMEGGSSVRNSTALAARRSSLKFSYVHIASFNESQQAKGQPSFHEIPEDTRMTVLRSWKNRNSVDLSKEMFDGLRRILAMDDKLAEVRSLRPSVPHKSKKKMKIVKDPKATADHLSKTAKWSTEESSDLIKACADVMNGPTETNQSATERESLIYDRFVARRQTAGDTDTPIRRDLRSMAQQWRYILSSYTYIKACNDNRSEEDSPAWFEMSPVQKRAYQQCTNVPLKFVDLDAKMFALVTETSFEGATAVSEPVPSSIVKNATEGISLRPRSTRKKTEAFWSSDSESSVVSTTVQHDNKSPATNAWKKSNNWPAEELWNLIQAWEEAAGLAKTSKLTSALNETFEIFTKLQGGPSNQLRSIHSVRNKMIALKASFAGISTFIADRGDSSAWFNLTSEQRLAEIRTWNNKTTMDLSNDVYDALARILHRKTSEAYLKSGTRKRGKHHADAKDQVVKGHAGQKPEKYIAANWSKEELLLLAEACGELLEGRRSRRYVFEEEKDRFYRRYEELGGTNSLGSAVGLARFVMDSYEFVYFYNQKAGDTNSLAWFELEPADRDPIIARMSKYYRSFNGLTNITEELYDIIDGIDAELRLKLGETKKKTYKPPSDAGSSRYVDIEAVVERCVFKTRDQATPKSTADEEPVLLNTESASEADASSPESVSGDEGSDSDVSAPVSSIVSTPRSIVQPDEDVVMASPRRRIVRRGSDLSRNFTPRKRTRSDDNSSTLYFTEIIQKQNRKLEEAVKRFRKDSSEARKEHHAFLLRKIQDSFPVDSGTGSFLERVAEQQGQTLVDIFQRLQQQRDTEKAKDEELMRQLFGGI